MHPAMSQLSGKAISSNRPRISSSHLFCLSPTVRIFSISDLTVSNLRILESNLTELQLWPFANPTSHPASSRADTPSDRFIRRRRTDEHTFRGSELISSQKRANTRCRVNRFSDDEGSFSFDAANRIFEAL
jgi:hypothetical protein